MDYAAGTEAAGTVVSAVAALLAWRAARHSAEASHSLSTVESRRWHADLTPQFRVKWRSISDSRAELRIELVGPSALDRLDELSIEIRDDIADRAPVIAGGPTQEEITAQIWGPYQFKPGIDGADPTGRRIEPIALPLGEWRPFALQRTMPPPWSSNHGDSVAQWIDQYDGTRLRLTLRCRRHGDDPWVVPIEVATTMLGQ